MTKLNSTHISNFGEKSQCEICDTRSVSIYTNLQDHLFGAEGSWNFSKCSNPNCALMWIDPKPNMEEIAKAYDGYYTHFSSSESRKKTFTKLSYYKVKRGYLSYRFGYYPESRSTVLTLLGHLLFLFPIRREEVDCEVRHLPAHAGGKLLDVGCGSGAWLLAMRDLGWNVQGLDFDANAIAVAAAKGLQVDHGSLLDQRYPTSSFDAITLNHVIEHLPNTIDTLAECHRILKPQGQLILYTPNSGSLGHFTFKGAWRGLEPPRHLYIFNPKSIRAALFSSGFKHVELHTHNSSYMWQRSLGSWSGRTGENHKLPIALKAVSRLLTLLEQMTLIVNPLIGECLAVKARKL